MPYNVPITIELGVSCVCVAMRSTFLSHRQRDALWQPCWVFCTIDTMQINLYLSYDFAPMARIERKSNYYEYTITFHIFLIVIVMSPTDQNWISSLAPKCFHLARGLIDWLLHCYIRILRVPLRWLSWGFSRIFLCWMDALALIDMWA